MLARSFFSKDRFPIELPVLIPKVQKKVYYSLSLISISEWWNSVCLQEINSIYSNKLMGTKKAFHNMNEYLDMLARDSKRKPKVT